MADDIKIGAYLCKGCGLGARLDSARLAAVAESEGGAAVVRQHDYLCSHDGVSAIRNDIQANGVTHVMIGACSRRAKSEAFNFDSPADGVDAAGGVSVARASLREGVIWSQPDTDEARELTQEMAEDYVRMGCAEVKFMRNAKASETRAGNKRILVVGGGISGMTAAVESARAGYEVLLVEKAERLGGWVNQLHRCLPSAEHRTNNMTDSRANDIAMRVAQVAAEGNITVFLNATVTRTSGAPGAFSVDITVHNGSTTAITENIGAIVQASGFSRYDANQLPEFSYGKTADVIDQITMEGLATQAADGVIRRPSDNKEVNSVVFVQCAGQRSEKPGHLPYCSGYCCNVSIKQAMYFQAQNPQADTHIIYTDLRTPGNGEDFYRMAQEKGVIFTNGVVAQVAIDDGNLDDGGDQNGALAVHFHDNILDEDARITADLVVLATGQVPNSGVDINAGKAAEQFEEGVAKKVMKKDAEKTTEQPNDKNNHNQIKVSVESILNLDYRQGADLPHLKHGFSDSHFICFPYETRRTGIYACGPVRRPMDIAQSIEDATGAAMKAIQAVEGAALGRAAHPRSGDLSYPSFRREGCTQCGRCAIECPFGAIDVAEDGYPQFKESRCRRCGTCMGACPVRVISFENYSVDTVGQQIKAIDMPDEFDEKPRILILACENDAYPALDMAAHNRIEYNAFVRVVPIRCLGSVNLIWVTDALGAGFDGIMLMGCKKGEDYQCHFVTGSALAHERMSKIDDTLEQLQLEADRVCICEVEITDINRVAKLINDYAAKIDEIGMNPFKGF